MNSSVLREEVDVYVGNDSFPDPESLQNKYGLAPVSKATAELSVGPDNRAEEFALREGKLLNMLSDKNKQIENLCVLMEALEPAPGMDAEKYKKIIEAGADDGVDFRDSKIVSLAKKCQKLTMTLNKERASSDNLAQQLRDQKQQVDSLTRQLAAAPKAASPTRNFGPKLSNVTLGTESISPAEATRLECNELNKELAAVNKALRDAHRNIDDLKHKVSQLTDENKGLTRALQQELGDATTVEHAVDGGWRGRAQQIVMLKAKIRKLESLSGSKSSGTSSLTARSNGGGGTNVDTKAETSLAEMSSERRMVVEALTEERARLLQVNEDLEKKNSAHKARIQNLEVDAKKMKENLQLVLNKTSTDDELLEAFRSEVAKLKQQLQSEKEKSKRFGRTNDVQQVREQAAAEVEKDNEANRQQSEILRLQRLCRHQAAQIDSQDETIRKMKRSMRVNV